MEYIYRRREAPGAVRTLCTECVFAGGACPMEAVGLP